MTRIQIDSELLLGCIGQGLSESDTEAPPQTKSSAPLVLVYINGICLLFVYIEIQFHNALRDLITRYNVAMDSVSHCVGYNLSLFLFFSFFAILAALKRMLTYIFSVPVYDVPLDVQTTITRLICY